MAFLISRSRRSPAVPSLSSSCSSEMVNCSTAMFSPIHPQITQIIDPLFSTTTPVLSHSLAQLRALAARRASRRADGPEHDRPRPHCSLLRPPLAPPVPGPPEIQSTLFHSLSVRCSTHLPGCAVCNRTD